MQFIIIQIYISLSVFKCCEIQILIYISRIYLTGYRLDNFLNSKNQNQYRSGHFILGGSRAE